MFFKRDKVQFVTALIVVQPFQPGREKIESKAKPGFKDDESPSAAPPRRQVIASKKDVASLGMTTVGGVVDLTENVRARRILGVKYQMGRFEGGHNVGLNINVYG